MIATMMDNEQFQRQKAELLPKAVAVPTAGDGITERADMLR